MLLIVIAEIITMYIAFVYLNEMDGYSVMVLISVSILMIMGSANGWVSVLMLVIIWPIYASYMEWVAIWISSLKLGESYNKIVSSALVISLGSFLVGVSYVIILTVVPHGIMGVVSAGSYLWIMIGCGVTLLMILYALSNLMVELNWNMLMLGLLPLPMLFVKQMGSWIVMYVVMYYGIINLV